MTILPYGDSAILINFEQKIDEDINIRVLALHRAIRKSAVPGITFYIPGYCSLTVGYDPNLTNYDTLYQEIVSIAKNISADSTSRKSRTLNIPVCYDDKFAPDMDDVMNETGLSKKEIIKLHTLAPFRVYMMGFLPGFAYLGKLPEALYCSRKTTPRLKIPPCSVGLAGYQTGIYPSEAPGGWQIIGKTPLNMFVSKKQHPFLCKAGDRVKFCPIPLGTFQYIEKAVVSGNFNLNSIYE